MNIWKTGLTCDSNVCKKLNIQPGGVCGDNELCAPEFSCDLNSKVCKKLNPKGEACSVANGPGCQSGLTCDSNVCKKLNVQPGGVCGENDLCVAGDPCISSKCIRFDVPLNGACGISEYCTEDLTCNFNVCKLGYYGVCRDDQSCVRGYICFGLGPSKPTGNCCGSVDNGRCGPLLRVK